jgi:hypothetical protein
VTGLGVGWLVSAVLFYIGTVPDAWISSIVPAALLAGTVGALHMGFNQADCVVPHSVVSLQHVLHVHLKVCAPTIMTHGVVAVQELVQLEVHCQHFSSAGKHVRLS